MTKDFRTKLTSSIIACTTVGILTLPLTPGTAFAATIAPIPSGGWAGYGVSGSPFPKPSQPIEVLYDDVVGGWTMPEASCGATEHSNAAFWVGLGGATALEQIGAIIQCDNSTLRYNAVYEILVPGKDGPTGRPVFIKQEVSPNDQLFAEVRYLGKGHYRLVLTNTGHWSFVSPVLSGSATAGAHNAALWIAEAPSVTPDKKPGKLTFFDRVYFTKCKARQELNTARREPISAGPTIDQFTMTPDLNQIYAGASPLDDTGTAFNVSIPQS